MRRWGHYLLDVESAERYFDLNLAQVPVDPPLAYRPKSYRKRERPRDVLCQVVLCDDQRKKFRQSKLRIQAVFTGKKLKQEKSELVGLHTPTPL